MITAKLQGGSNQDSTRLMRLFFFFLNQTKSSCSTVCSLHPHLAAPTSHLKGSLVGGEGDEAAAVRRELSQEAGGLLHVDHGEVGEKVLVEAANSVPLRPGSARADPSPLQTVNDILVLDPSGLESRGVVIHRCDYRQ